MPNDILEKTIEDIIYENRKMIHARGLAKLKDKAFRQVILPSGKKIDILGFEISDGDLYCDIYELKRQVINADAISQAYGYYQELKNLTKNHFKSFNAQIILVGRKYEQVPVLDALSIPVHVYTYEYKMDGIWFVEMKNTYSLPEPNESFSLGLWAFGYAGLYFVEDQSSMSFHSSYDSYVREKPAFAQTVNAHLLTFVKPQRLLSYYEPIPFVPRNPIDSLKLIKTEVFPEQPDWSKDFLDGIPHHHILDDIEFDEDCDLEAEEDNDLSDYEHEDDERWFTEEWNPEINNKPNDTPEIRTDEEL